MPLVLCTHPLHPRPAAMLAAAADIVVASALDAETLTRECRDADVVIVRAPMPAELFAGQRRLRMAVRHGAGLDWIPMEAATKAGVLVANVPGANARTVAEHVLFVAMALLRRFRAVDRDLRQHGWLAGRDHANVTHELAGKTIGIVGMGNIGRNVATIARDGFAMSVIANSRSAAGLPEGVPFRAMDELLAESDIVALCCPLTEATRGMIDARRIALMKPSAVLVNVSRGAIIVDDALIEALREGAIGGAALDVFVTQPLPPDHAYFGFENVIVTPHMAGITEESMMRMGIGSVEETLRVLAGGLPVELRNPEVVARYRQRFGL